MSDYNIIGGRETKGTLSRITLTLLLSSIFVLIFESQAANARLSDPSATLPSKICIPVPYHAQRRTYWCGPASLEMVFDFYGPDIPQNEIADVAGTSPEGTFTSDMIRGAHFSNASASVGDLHVIGYTARKLGYAAFDCGGMTMDELKSLLAAGYPIIVLTPWHYRVAVGFDSTCIIFQDSLYGPMFRMAFDDFDVAWESGSGHWGLFISPWEVEVSNSRNVAPGDIFNVTATTTYTWASPFPQTEYPTSMTNATITLPSGLTLVTGETAKKTVGTGNLAAGDSANVTWTVQADSLGAYLISVEAESEVIGFDYEDRIGGYGQNSVAVTLQPDESPPTTLDDYDGLWHNQDFEVNLTSEDDMSGVLETYYKINDGWTKTLTLDGQPYFTTSDANNTLEYWSVDWAGNEELPHKFSCGIKLDKTDPEVGLPSCTPSSKVKPEQEVKVTVYVIDAVSGVKNVTLLYTVTDGAIWENLAMNYISTDLYEATIPGQSLGTQVKFKIVAYDNVGNEAFQDKSYRVQAELTIATTIGGTTDPWPSPYYYWYVTTESVTATPYTGYLFDHWELDGTNVGSTNPYMITIENDHTLEAVFSPIPPLSVSISPASASVNIGQSITFASTVSGGYPPYRYQWYLNGNPVSGATSSSWTFNPTAPDTSGIYGVYLGVTDAKNNSVQSETSRVSIVVPVGGYSHSTEEHTLVKPLMPCLTLVAILTLAFTAIKRTTRRRRQS